MRLQYGLIALGLGIAAGLACGDVSRARADSSPSSRAAPQRPDFARTPASTNPGKARTRNKKAAHVSNSEASRVPGKAATTPSGPVHLGSAESDAVPAVGEGDPLDFLLDDDVYPIDLYSALLLAGVQNPDLLLAQQRVLEAVALRQLAAAQFLPTLNLGTNFFAHSGVYQQPSGNILSVSTSSLYVGAGAGAVGAGTINIPGVLWNLNLSEAVFRRLASLREVDRRSGQSRATSQDVLLSVALNYNELVRAEGNRSIAILTRNDARELARITAAYLKTGAGRQADADRAATEFALRDADVARTEADVVGASARLCQLLNLDPTLRLHATDNQAVPKTVVPDPLPVEELLAIALLHRPETAERRAAFEQALLNLQGARTLPFSPTVLLGFSAGSFGGGSNLAAQPVGTSVFAAGQSRFGNFASRSEFDAMAYWTLRNLGVGNKAQIAAARSRATSADLAQLETLDRVRAEVAAAHARTHARFEQIITAERAIRSSSDAFAQDMQRIRGQEGIPIETVNSLRLLARARFEYLRTIVDYNQAQVQLYVALGQPPTDLLVRPVEGTENGQRIREIDVHPVTPELEAPDAGAGLPAAETELAGLEFTTIVPAPRESCLIDLPTALRLAEVENPTIALGRQALVEAVALQTEARGLMLPTLNAGVMYHLHNGALQTSAGEIRTEVLQSFYAGGGTQVVGQGTVAIPAIRIFSQLGDAIYAPLAAGQTVSSRQMQSIAVQNAILLLVVTRYLDLAAAETDLDALRRSEADLRQIVQATAAFSRIGQGRLADYNRARSDALQWHLEQQRAQERVAVAAADLSRVLHLDPSIRLQTQAGALEVVELVDPEYTLESLVDMARSARPDLAARSAEICAAQHRVDQENVRPWLPTVSVGYSEGAFGGGSNRPDLGAPSFFGPINSRTDFDVSAYWTLQNLGFGNQSLQKQRRAERDQLIAQRGQVFNQIGREVGDALAQVDSQRRQVALARRRLQTAAEGAREEINRTRGGEGLPLEAINSINLLVEARRALITAVAGYDLAQFQLFVAIGQTPHAALPDPTRTLSPDSSRDPTR